MRAAKTEGRYRLLVTMPGGGMLFARVRLSIAHRSSGGPAVQAGLEDGVRVPTVWTQAALQGASRAATKAGLAPALVVLRQVQGTMVDTTPSAVAIAAYLAVCDAVLETTPPRTEIRRWLGEQRPISLYELKDSLLESLDRTNWATE